MSCVLKSKEHVCWSGYRCSPQNVSPHRHSNPVSPTFFLQLAKLQRFFFGAPFPPGVSSPLPAGITAAPADDRIEKGMESEEVRAGVGVPFAIITSESAADERGGESATAATDGASEVVLRAAGVSIKGSGFGGVTVEAAIVAGVPDPYFRLKQTEHMPLRSALP
jgi:hypothetical protein